MTDELHRRILDAVTGDAGPDGDRRLAEDLAEHPELREELETLRRSWRALGELPAGTPPEGARDRARKALLRARGPSRRAVLIRRTAGIAAALLLFLAGGVAGVAWDRTSRPPVPDAEGTLPTVVDPAPDIERPLFAFIIRGEPAADEADIELAMSGFARELWSEDRLVWAERLAVERSAWVDGGAGMPPASVPDAARLFMVRAASREEAVRLARRAPHLAEGGVIEILGSSATPGG